MPRVRNSQRLSVKDRPGRLKLFARRARRHARPILIGGGLCTLALLAGISLRKAEPGSMADAIRGRIIQTTASAGLRVRHVEVLGRVNTAEDILQAAIGVSSGDPMLAVSLDEMRARIESLNSVRSAVIERRLPDRLVVHLREREPFAIWQHQGKFTLVDRNGNAMGRDLSESAGLPLIVGNGAPQAAAHLMDVLNRHQDLRERMAAAVRVGERRWNLRLRSGADIMLPEGHEEAAIARLMGLHQEQNLLDRPLKSVDLRLPDRLVVRPLAAEPKPNEPARGGAPRRPT